MNRIASLIILLFMILPAPSQVILDDFPVNNKSMNTDGLGKPALAVHSSGEFAVVWQDYNQYNTPGPELPQIAVQKFNPNGAASGQLYLFRGESRALSSWTSDYLEDADVAYMPDRTLLITFEHSGRLHIGGDDIGSSEIGIGAISPSGQIIDLNNTNGVAYWLIYTTTRYQENPRLAMSPNGDFYIAGSGNSYETNRNTVFVQPFDAAGNLNGTEIYPHASANQPQAQHLYPDFVTNGESYLMVWQDGRNDANFDITAQFFSSQGPIGANIKVNNGDPSGTYNVFPSAAMNATRQSVVVWADTRHGFAGEIYGQLFDGNGKAVGNNFQISAGQGEIYYRPEVSMLGDGSFMAVWSDSSSVPGNFRARARQFDASGRPLGAPFLVPNNSVASGLPNITTDGSAYYIAWLDSRDGQAYWNLYTKKMGTITDIEAPISENELKFDYKLDPAFPNPFNAQTTLSFQIDQAGPTALKIFDLSGRLVSSLLDQYLPAGSHEIAFDGSSISSGIYVAKLKNAGKIAVQRIVLLK